VPELIAGEVARICGGRLRGDEAAAARSVVADSREVTQGAAFAAVRGGIAFVPDALASGAPFAIVDRGSAAASDGTLVEVDDVVAALGTLAADVRRRLDLRVVAITGSTGKTLTKDFTAAALGERVHATPRSFNAELGVPLVVLTCPDDARVLVVELAARHPGEIGKLCAIVDPDLGIVTGIGVSHISEFGSREAIARTKSELLRAVKHAAVVPSDDEYLPLMSSSTEARMITVGPGGHVSYGARCVDAKGRTHGWVRARDHLVDVVLPVPGRALVRNAAFAVAAAAELGVDSGCAAERIGAAPTSAWRMQVVEVGPYAVVNDAWNANPTSSASALRTVKEMALGAQTWAVLGGMAELGTLAPRAHERVGRLARAIGFTGVVAVGEAATGIANGAGAIALTAPDETEAARVVASHAEPGAWVLAKASRAVGMEDFPEVLRREVDG
jgi:UDP-N-acetylmuramoyl-tripeptide--D-alanyl-D-alanine ligase